MLLLLFVVADGTIAFATAASAVVAAERLCVLRIAVSNLKESSSIVINRSELIICLK